MRLFHRGFVAVLGIGGVLAMAALSVGSLYAQKKSAKPVKQAIDANGSPVFKVDPFWPKLLPNRWSMQQVTGLWVDDKTGHVWFLNRANAADGDETGGDGNPPRIDCCLRGPEAIELDQEGNVVSSFGGPGYHPMWPTNLQTIIVDRQGNLWISGTGAQDSIIKFSHDGKFLWDFGHRPPKDIQPKEDNQNTDWMISKGRFNLDEDAQEIYIINAKRVVVYDMNTGAFKRGWGGHGMALSEIPNGPLPTYEFNGGPPTEEKNFAPDLHFVEFDKDGLVYIGERGQNRISIYTKQGKWVKDYMVSPNTPSQRSTGCGGLANMKLPPCGTTYKMVFSKDPEQTYMYVADGTNNHVWILDRKTGKTLGKFGSNGKYAGQLHWINAIGTDRQGNIYTGEVEQAKRIQKFVPVPAGK
ncbi:MAG: hypothetical protein ABL967_11290 [Bryobacteraceae bacterium]